MTTKRLNVRDLKLRLNLCPDTAEVLLLDEDGQDHEIDKVLVFTKESQVWITFNHTDTGLDDDDEDVDPNAPSHSAGDMCVLPEVCGDQQAEVLDVCEVQSRGKSKRA